MNRKTFLMTAMIALVVAPLAFAESETVEQQNGKPMSLAYCKPGSAIRYTLPKGFNPATLPQPARLAGWGPCLYSGVEKQRQRTLEDSDKMLTAAR